MAGLGGLHGGGEKNNGVKSGENIYDGRVVK